MFPTYPARNGKFVLFWAVRAIPRAIDLDPGVMAGNFPRPISRATKSYITFSPVSLISDFHDLVLYKPKPHEALLWSVRKFIHSLISTKLRRSLLELELPNYKHNHNA